MSERTAKTILSAFLPPVRDWFAETFGAPTPPQAQGWPAIQRGDHTLILAPTGSGKTLTAFLWGIDQLFKELDESANDELRITNHESKSHHPKSKIQNPKSKKEYASSTSPR